MPRNETTTRTLYTFDELSDDAKEHALDKLRDLNVSHEWWEFTYDDAVRCAALIGIEIDRIYFTGFSSQGDGACFEGSYSYAKGGLAAIKEHAPQDAELHRIAQALQDIQRAAFYRLTASVKQRGHYYHSLCTEIDVVNGSGETTCAQYDAIKDTLRAYMEWVYARLESEYEYLTSDEQVKECIEANEYEFTENGELS